MLSYAALLSLVSAAVHLAGAETAPTVASNPKDVVAIADFPSGFDKNVQGNIIFSAKEGGKVNVHVDVTGLPADGGPFQYHIHETAIPANGNCDLAGDHFDPYKGATDCDSQKNDARCQLGDLSGKHGWINTTCFETKFTEPYLSLNKKSKAYIVGKSVVFHFANSTKFACADIELATPSKINSVIHEYSVTDADTLKDLQQSVQEDYVFDEDAALAAEYKDTAVLAKKYGNSSYTDDDDYYSDEFDPNCTNKSNATQFYYSSDCENGSPLRSIGLGAGLAGLVGLLL